MLQKIPRYRSEKHLDYVRSKPCCSCGHPSPSEAHHLIGVGQGIMGSKEDDSLTIPLCRTCHNLVHANKNSIDQTYYLARFIREAFANGDMGLLTYQRPPITRRFFMPETQWIEYANRKMERHERI